MNKIYRKVWSTKLGAYVAVSEAAKSKSKSGGLVASVVFCASLLASNAFAQTTNWTTWTLPSSYSTSLLDAPTGYTSYKYATGIGGSLAVPGAGSPTNIGITVSGEILNSSTGSFAYWDRAGTSSQVAAGSLSNTAMIAQSGYSTTEFKSHTIKFSSEVSNVLMSIFSLGNPDSQATLRFTQPFVILSTNNGASNELVAGADYAITSSSSGYDLNGKEGNGVIQFLGTYQQISWTITQPEVYNGFNIGLTTTPRTDYTNTTTWTPQVGDPNYFPLPTPFTSIRPINASNDVTSGLGSVTTRVFDGGTLVLAANNASDFTVTAKGGSMNVAASEIVTASGVISNEPSNVGFFKKVGDGRLILTGANTYSGGTTVEKGVLQVSTNSNLGTGGLTLNGGGLATTDNITTSRTVAVGSSNGTLEVASGKSLTLTGVMSGSGALTKTSAGSLVLNGTNTQTGALNVNAGTLVLNGSTTSSTLSVANGAVLTGSGSTSGAVALAGTVKPGSSPGTLSVAGDFTMAANSRLETEINGRVYSPTGGSGSYDRIALTGTGIFTANGTVAPVLRGITGVTSDDFSPVVGDAFRVVTTAKADGVDAVGAFSSVADPATGMPANSRFDVIYGSNFIDLVLTPKSLEEFAKPYGIQNMVNAAVAFDVIRPTQGARGTTDKQQFFNGLYGMGADALSNTVLQASGEIHAFALSEARQGWQAGTKAIGSVAGIKAERNLWVDASGEKANFKQDAYASAYTSNRAQLWIGTHVLEHKDVQVGVAGGLSTGRVNAQRSGSASVDTQALAIYAIGRHADFDYSAVGSLNRSSIDTTRQTGLSTGALSNTSESTAQGAVLSLSAGMKHAISDKVNGRVWINGTMDQTRAKALSEQGSAVTALGVTSESFKSAQATLGYTVSGNFNIPDNRPGQWMLGAGVSHQVDQGRPHVSRQMSLHGADWQVTAPKLGSVTQFLQAGLRVPLASNAEAWVNVGGSQRQGASAKGGNVGLSVRW